MEAHALLQKRGFNVWSFGTGTNVKLPGISPDKPIVYNFRVPYREIYEELRAQNEEFFRNSAVLPMLERNMAVKPAPERWQDRERSRRHFDVVVTFEERVFEAVLEDSQLREPIDFQLMHVVNLEVRDTYADAAEGAVFALHLCEQLDEALGSRSGGLYVDQTFAEASGENLDSIERVLNAFEDLTGRRLLYAPSYT
jgi:RNA polymerase II subunit A C-terminal domain phosphatase SSU72